MFVCLFLRDVIHFLASEGRARVHSAPDPVTEVNRRVVITWTIYEFGHLRTWINCLHVCMRVVVFKNVVGERCKTCVSGDREGIHSITDYGHL